MSYPNRSHRRTEIFISVSIGVALSTPGCTSEDLLRDADTALYRAKSAGRCRWEDLRREDARVIERVKLEADLRHAVERGQFALLYQPIVSLADRTVKGFETLLRWDHPERGRIAPIDFIKVAEDTGLIVPMGLWVVDEVCRQIREWESTGVIAEQFTVSVNLSTRQLAQADLVDRVAAIVRHHGVQPTRLEFEITESAMMANPEVARRLVGDLKTLGFRISLDDRHRLPSLSYCICGRSAEDRRCSTDATTPDWGRTASSAVSWRAICAPTWWPRASRLRRNWRASRRSAATSGRATTSRARCARSRSRRCSRWHYHPPTSPDARAGAGSCPPRWWLANGHRAPSPGVPARGCIIPGTRGYHRQVPAHPTPVRDRGVPDGSGGHRAAVPAHARQPVLGSCRPA
jgi:hypothetical protein